MFFSGKSFKNRVLFLGFLVCGVQNSSMISAQASHVEQAFLFAYGFATRWAAHSVGPIATNIAAEAIPQEAKDALYALSKDITQNAHAAIDSSLQAIEPVGDEKISLLLKALFDGAKDIAIDLTPSLTSLNVAIFLWTIGLLAYEQARAKISGLHLPFEVEGAPLAQLLRLVHMGGMDLYWAWVTFNSLTAAYQMILETPEVAYRAALSKNALADQNKDAIGVVPVVGDIQLQLAQSAGMFMTGLLIGYVSFNLMSVPLAGMMTKSWGEKTLIQRFVKNFAFVTILFDVGIVLAAASSRILFDLGQATGFLEGCHACKAAYQAGEDSAYVVSDVLGNWHGIYLQEKNLKPKKD